MDGNVTDIEDLYSVHKESDPRIALHVVFASSATLRETVCVVSDDTDVFIIHVLFFIRTFGMLKP